MANLTLTLDELGHAESLPDVCSVCGEPATHLERTQFTQAPHWVWFVILFFPPVGLLFLLIERRKAVVFFPFCDYHRNHFWKQFFLRWGLMMLAFGSLLGIPPIALMLQGTTPLFGDVPNNSVVSVFFAGLSFIFLFCSGYFANSGPRRQVIDGNKIWFTGVHSRLIAEKVHQNFAEALEEQRDEDEC